MPFDVCNMAGTDARRLSRAIILLYLTGAGNSRVHLFKGSVLLGCYILSCGSYAYRQVLISTAVRISNLAPYVYFYI